MDTKLLVLSAPDVHALLSYSECAAAMRGALTALACGEAQQPLRTIVAPDGAAGLMALMPSYLTGEHWPDSAYGLKAICITPAIRPPDWTRTRVWSCCPAARPASHWLC